MNPTGKEEGEAVAEMHEGIEDGSEYAVEEGELQVFVGGGQPDFYDSHVSASARIKGERPLLECQ